jgi:glycosyltransferase involved in cell wall biosynthesis
MMKPSLMVVIPALNEEDAIGDVVRSVKRALPHAALLVIDDHSSDNTASVAERAGAKVTRLTARRGLGSCVRTGYRTAYELGYEWVIRIDGDGQHEADDISKILDALMSTGADMVIGSRFIAPCGWRPRFARSVGIALFRRLLAPVLGKTVHDPTSGFVGVNRRALEVFSHALPPVYPEIGALIMLRRHHFRFHEISCRMYPRRTGRSSFTPLRSLQYTLHVLVGILAITIQPWLTAGRAGRHGFEGD